jgi:hypothetical protein
VPVPALHGGAVGGLVPRLQPSEKVGVVFDQRSALRRMTAQQLLELGTYQVVYLRAGIHDGERLLLLYGADGSPLAITNAVETAAEHGLAFVTVH